MRPFLRSLRYQNSFNISAYSRRPAAQFFSGLNLNHIRRYALAYESPSKFQPRIAEAVLIFHAGTLKTTFVGLLKATTVVIAVANTGIVVPKLLYFGNPDQSQWLGPIVAVVGVIPLAYVFWSGGPFVASAALKPIPFQARLSTEHFARWIDKLPHNSEIEFKVFAWNGFFQRTTVSLAELRTKKSRLGIENLVRLHPPKGQPKRFYVGKERKANARTKLWEKVLRQIEPFDA